MSELLGKDRKEVLKELIGSLHEGAEFVDTLSHFSRRSRRLTQLFLFLNLRYLRHLRADSGGWADPVSSI